MPGRPADTALPLLPKTLSASKKVTVTLKPSLVGSRLPPLARYEDAAPGGRSHGVVTGATDLGVFVSFFGGVTGEQRCCGCSAGTPWLPCMPWHSEASSVLHTQPCLPLSSSPLPSQAWRT